ncbi:MAG: hypothetical protein EOO57_00695, partial [Hymenobacter sp.]
MKITFCSFLLAIALLGVGARQAAAQVRRPAPGKAAPGKPGVKTPPPPPPPVEAARRVVEE